MDLYVGGRASGKTQRLLDWVLQGVEADGYPGWSRVLIVPTMEQLEDMRERVRHRCVKGGIEWAEIDFSHRIYAWEEWRTANRAVLNPETEIALDNVDFYFPSIFGRLKIMSLSTALVHNLGPGADA